MGRGHGWASGLWHRACVGLSGKTHMRSRLGRRFSWAGAGLTERGRGGAGSAGYELDRARTRRVRGEGVVQGREERLAGALGPGRMRGTFMFSIKILG